MLDVFYVVSLHEQIYKVTLAHSEAQNVFETTSCGRDMYLEFVSDLAPFISREAGGGGWGVVLSEGTTFRVQPLQTSLTELCQMGVDALISRPVVK